MWLYLSLFICQSVDGQLDYFYFGLLWIMLPQNLIYNFCVNMFSFLKPRVELLDCIVSGGSEDKASACNAGDRVWSLGWEDALEEERATHSSILAWRIPWTEEPGGLQSMGSQRVEHDWATSKKRKDSKSIPFRNLQAVFMKWPHHFIFPPEVNESSSFSISSLFGVTWLFHTSYVWSAFQVVSHYGFDLNFPND